MSRILEKIGKSGILLILVCVPFFTFTSAASATIPTDASEVWTALDDLQRESWANGALTTDGEVAVADAVAGTAGIMAVGPIAIVAGGAVAVDAVWHSGLGSAVGHWLYNTLNPVVESRVTGQDWCPYVQATWSGDYGTQTVTPPAPSCGTTATGDYLIGKGSQLPAYGAQKIHLYDSFVCGNPATDPSCNTPVHVGFNSDSHNYATMDFHGSCTDFTNTGMWGLNNMTDFSMFMDVNPSLWTGTHSGHQWDCVSNAWDIVTGNPHLGNLVSVDNGTCVISQPTGPGPCGTGGATCKQYAIQELSTSADGSTNYTGDCYFVAMTEREFAEMLGGTTLTPCGNTGQIACPTTGSNFKNIGSNTTTTNCGGQSPCIAALDKLDNETGICSYNSGNCGTPATQQIHQHITCYNAGTCQSGSDSLTVPRPQLTETYAQYVARLRALGFWGFIYEVDDDMDYPSGSPAQLLTPGLMTEIQIGTNSPIPLYYPFPSHGLAGAPSSFIYAGQPYKWPGTQSGVTPGTTITILKVPDTYTGGGSPGSGGPCNCPGINFNPLTGLSYGSKFPFGVFTTLGNLTGSFSGAGSGTPVSFSLPLGGSSRTITLGSSSWESTYRPIVFPILEFLMTIAAIIWFSLRVMGHPGGDAEGTE